ncbi:MAG: TIGR02147 family protein [Chitinivibrionales bacterium]|nr:TIGR02147 family protein [Chitinivibrionales bacterium]MBD3355898.1 TIGR02147 family protein [Chitinivibrionales bacterium]
MLKIFDYRDPQRFLRDAYCAKHAENPRFSYGYIAKKLGGLSPTSVYNMLYGRVAIRCCHIKKLCTIFSLAGGEAEYFEHLVRARRNQNGSTRRSSLMRLAKLWNKEMRVLSSTHAEYYAKWYYTAVRSLVALKRYGPQDYEEMAKLFDPPLTTEDIQEALRVLTKLGLVKRGADDAFMLVDKSVTSGTSDEATALVRNYNLAVMEQAQRVLEKPSKADSDFSTLTLSVSEETAAKLMEELRLLRKRIMGMIQFDNEADRVYQFNMQMFPVAWKGRPATRSTGR